MNNSKFHDLGKALGHHKTDMRLDILRKLEEAGSISQAARLAGVSYKAAWQALDVLSNIAGTPLVEKNVGGVGGGGARLTQAGKNLLHASSELTQMKDQLMRQTKAYSQVRHSTGKLLGLNTSMRNQFPVVVRGVVKKGPFVRVMFATKGGNVFHSSITATSAELLEIKKDQGLLALCKATAIKIVPQKGRQPKPSTMGIVIRKSRGTQMGEVSLLIEPGITLAGMCDQLSLIRIGDEAYADIEESAWVLAISDI
jgi:molybdate transport system regulatory protein